MSEDTNGTVQASLPKDAAPLAGVNAVPSSQSSLDSLFSPTSPNLPLRESVAVSDATDDDTGFSTVALSARQSLDVMNSRLSLSSNASDLAKDDRRRTVALDSSDVATLVNPEENRHHKKSASTSTILSANNIPFLLSRLDLQKAQEEDDSESHRMSKDGQQKLQEEFNRMQNDVQTEDVAPVEDSIDWGLRLSSC